MPHQVALTIRAPIMPAEVDALEEVFAQIRQDVETNDLMPFGKLRAVHFARFVIIPGGTGTTVENVKPTLIWASNVDAPLEAHLENLVAVGGEGLDEIYRHCEGYPEAPSRDAASRLAYLRRHMIPAQAFYVNTVGRSLTQVRQESLLRERIEDHLDDLRTGPEWSKRGPENVRDSIVEFVLADPELHWALDPAGRPNLPWRLKEKARFAAIVLGGVVLLPMLIVIAPVGLIALRIKEWQDLHRGSVSRRLRSRGLLARREDQVAQNQFSAVGEVKPGLIRLVAAQAVLRLAGVATRHLYNNGDLGTVKPLGLTGVDTIHFARWISIDGGRRVLFMSNYDGSLESYMDDFINKVAWGLNAVFTHGRSYPPTRWLVLGGARDEQAFKEFLRTHQVPTGVWYSAIKNLTTENVSNNAAIRAGLTQKLDPRQLTKWLRRF
jgi:hypothetical protein